MTANLQTRRTVKEAARIFRVSERSVYTALKILRSGRSDLVAAVERGEMSLHAALKQIEPPRRADTLKPLVRAWNAATAQERTAFIAAVDGDVGANLQICSPVSGAQPYDRGA